MAFEPVEAVFIWKYSKSPFAACYGRLQGTKYSKDFLQSPAEQFPEIDRSLGWESDQMQFEYRWPGGSRPGYWRHSAADERGQLAWPTSQAPDPWKLGDPNTQEAITFPGNPGALTEQDADAEFDKLDALNLDPYIIAVKLQEQDKILHVRACVKQPIAGLEMRGVAQLPDILQAAINGLSAGGTAVRLELGSASRAQTLTNRILKILEQEPNVLLVGPPGTGKTVALEDLRAAFERNSLQLLFDPDKWDNNWRESPPIAGETKVVSLVFHPSYSYENFVAGLMPSTGAGLNLKAQPGPLISLAHWASGGDRKALIILDEFNRGSAAAIFGDTLALLDRDKRDTPSRPGAWITRPFPDDMMEVADEFRRSDAVNVPDRHLKLPLNVKIVAAMNSTDRSVAPIDAALRRRFAMVSVGPDYETLETRLGLPRVELNAAFSVPTEWTPERVKELAVRLLAKINDRVLAILGADFQLGHALLWHVSGDTAEDVTRTLAHAFDERVAATLRMTFIDEDTALAAALGIDDDHVDDDHVGYWHRPTGKLSKVAQPRLVLPQLAEINSYLDVLSRLGKVLRD